MAGVPSVTIMACAGPISHAPRSLAPGLGVPRPMKRILRAIAYIALGALLGVALLYAFLVWSLGDPLDSGWMPNGEVTRTDGAVVRRWSRSIFDPAEGCESTWDRYEVLRDGKIIQSEEHSRSNATRSYSQEQALALFREAGFGPIEVFSEFSRTPAAPSDGLFTIVGIRQR